MTGYISVHRKMMQSAIWSDPNYLKLWMYCLFKASYKDREILLGNNLIKLSPGQFITGRKSLTEELNYGVKPEQKLSEKSWERYLKNLEKWEMLTIKVTNKYSVVTVVKYSVYQNKQDEVDHVVDQQMTNNCPTDDQQLTTNNNLNKGNKGIKDLSLYSEVIDYLNHKAETSYKSSTKKTQQLINARVADNFKLEDFKRVIDIKTAEWLNNKDMSKFLRPETLFGTKFESYLNQKTGAASYKPNEQVPSYKPLIVDYSRGED